MQRLHLLGLWRTSDEETRNSLDHGFGVAYFCPAVPAQNNPQSMKADSQNIETYIEMLRSDVRQQSALINPVSAIA